MDASRPAAQVPCLEARNVVKAFGGVQALRGVSLSVCRGQVTCLLGDNGAGKSTLIKVLSGVHEPDSGDVLIDVACARRARRSSAASEPSTRTSR